MTFTAFTLLRPWCLIVIPIIAIMILRSIRRAAPLGDWVRVVDPALMAHLVRSGAVLGSRRQTNLAAALTATWIAIGLTGPATERDDDVTFRNLDETVIVLDLSRSVTDGGNLQNVRQAASTIAHAAGTRSIALIVYAGDAYLAASPTTDRDSLDTILFALDGDTVPDHGSHPERALALARQTLTEADIIAADVILISDGNGIGESALREAQAIRARGWTVQTLFVPTNSPRSPNIPDPDRSALKTLANSGGGVTAEIDNPSPILDVVSHNVIGHFKNGNYTILSHIDLGRWIVLLAIFPTLFLFRRSA